MSTLLFVHGTGVREPQHRKLVEQITHGLAATRPDVRVASCYWGAEGGAELHAHGASIPDYDATRAPDPRLSFGAGDDVAVWALLYADPVFELRLAARPGETPDEPPPHRGGPGDDLADRARVIADSDPDLRHLVDAAGISGQLLPAIDDVLADEACQDALDLLAPDPELPFLLSRAFVAEAVRRLGEPGQSPPPLDGAARDRVVRHLAAAMAGACVGDVRSAAGRLASMAGRVVWRLGAARAVERRRGVLTDAAHPVAGDVLVYLARGTGIRALIAEQVVAAEKPVMLVGHSLGGIAAVDLLASHPQPGVRVLVTVGSQAPLLYEIGALPSLPYGTPLPAEFPPWLNVYDRRDLLSYVGEGLFPGRVCDVEVEGRQPFPYAHSAYWSNPALYELLAAELP